MKPSALARTLLICVAMPLLASCAGQWAAARRILRGESPHPSTQSVAAMQAAQKLTYNAPGEFYSPRPPSSVIEREAAAEETAQALFQQLITQP